MLKVGEGIPPFLHNYDSVFIKVHFMFVLSLNYNSIYPQKSEKNQHGRHCPKQGRLCLCSYGILPLLMCI